jgi:hypothetical protein
MPDPYHKLNSPSAKARRMEKYLMAPTDEHPHRFFHPIKALTQQFRDMMKSKNYIRIITQVDQCKWILTQWYIYCEDDLWICGDAMVLNSEPSKKILCQPLCVKTRRTCPVHGEESKEFLMICPTCRNVGVAVKGSYWECKECDQTIPYNLIDDVPYLVLSCGDCPVKIGMEAVKAKIAKQKNFYFQKLQVRPHTAMNAVSQMMEDLKNTSSEGEEVL